MRASVSLCSSNLGCVCVCSFVSDCVGPVRTYGTCLAIITPVH